MQMNKSGIQSQGWGAVDASISKLRPIQISISTVPHMHGELSTLLLSFVNTEPAEEDFHYLLPLKGSKWWHHLMQNLAEEGSIGSLPLWAFCVAELSLLLWIHADRIWMRNNSTTEAPTATHTWGSILLQRPHRCKPHSSHASVWYIDCICVPNLSS